MDASAAESPDRRSGEVKSVARAAALLACFAESDSALSLSELGRRTGLTSSTAHRLLGTLCREGLLCRERGSERFLPGPLLLRLSRSTLFADDLGEISEHLRQLTEETRESACFGVRRGDEVAILLASSSAEPLRVDVAPGARTPMATSAMGLALLAHGDAPVDEAIAELRDGPPDLRVDVLAAQFRGVAVVDGRLGIGTRELAIPIRSGGPSHAVLGLLGPRDRMAGVDRLAAVMRVHAGAIAALATTAAL